MGRRGGVCRGIEIVAQRSAESRLIALLHGDLVKGGRPQVAALRGEELGKRPRFGFELLRPALGFVQGLA